MVAARRWNATGIGVRFERVDDPDAAKVLVRSDRGRLRDVCGEDCLGWTSTLGQPRSGRSTVTLGAGVVASLSPLSVWVAAHELGHVLGLEHRRSGTCTLMKPKAFIGACKPSPSRSGLLSESLGCIPAPADVQAAARLYGRDPAAGYELPAAGACTVRR
jgi:hypothetical protein